MEFIADLHIHSRFSRATAKNLDFENLYMAAQIKGITVVGTGDFTHPGWFSEIKAKLEPAEEGLFKLKDDIAEYCNQKVPQSCRGIVRFVLESEISNIYKKDHKTRKNHNLVFVPNFEVAENFTLKLDKIGNIRSDGRPILGLDARNLLEILMETSDQAFLIPAHIWTPWFSILGSKSGFDSLEECYEDLTGYIFAVETGLSSDPPMNWQVSALDGLTLVSNSDAHSPFKLGREANILKTELSYDSIKNALKTGDSNRFLGTVEFYPEEGKYHLDGHRKCNVRMCPEETRSLNGKCPVCEKPMTLGVLYRINELADRARGDKPEKCHPYYNLIPLTEILSEILKVGPGSKKVMGKYFELLEKLGPEFKILQQLNPEIVDSAGIPLLAEAIVRMRNNKIVVRPGYDGEFGTIKIFNSQERETLLGQKSLFVLPKTDSDIHSKTTTRPFNAQKDFQDQHRVKKPDQPGWRALNTEQLQVVEHSGGPLMIVAGPGTGKTQTLTYRIARLMIEEEISPQKIMAVTFTNKAAQEMRRRLRKLVNHSIQIPFVGTFHSFCFKLLSDYYKAPFTVIDDEDRRILLSDALKYAGLSDSQGSVTARKWLEKIIAAKQQIIEPTQTNEKILNVQQQGLAAVYTAYQKLLSIQGLCDYEDLIMKSVLLLEGNDTVKQKYQKAFPFIFIDEYQDLNHGQYRILRSLAPTGAAGRNICVIGDPDQSIYGFRGSDIKYFKMFIKDYPDAKTVFLTHNYRSTQTILDASYQMLNARQRNVSGARIYSRAEGIKTVSVFETDSEKAEAVAVGKTIERLIGGTGFHSIDFGRGVDDFSLSNRSFSDFAILSRTSEQHRIFSEVFHGAGIPFQVVNRETIFKAPGISELISLLKVIEGQGCYSDLDRIRNVAKPGISRQILEIMKRWSFQNGFSLARTQANARRLPIKGLSKSRQLKLNDFFDHLEEMAGRSKEMTIAKKLLFLMENSRLAEIIQQDPNAREAAGWMIEKSQTFGNDRAAFFATAALQTDIDTYRPRSESVALLTMHAAKGLEFPVVFIVGCEDGYLPFQRSGEDASDIDEERRLFYVAMTRAEECLYLSYARKRNVYGKTQARKPSPFIDEIERRLRSHEALFPAKQKQRGAAQLKLF